MSVWSLDALDAATIRFARLVAVIGLIALLVLSAIILANAFMRWIFSQPIEGVRDWVKLVVAVAVGGCLPAVLALRQNVAIRYVGGAFGGRVYIVLELFGALFVLTAFGVLAWLLQIYTLELRIDRETTENIGMLIWPWWQGVTTLFYLSVLVQILVVAGLVVGLVRGRLPIPHTQAPDDQTSEISPGG